LVFQFPLLVYAQGYNSISNYYGNINMGYAHQPWKEGLGATWASSTWKNGNGGFSMGVNLGVKLTSNIAAEMGYVLLPTTKLHASAGVFGNSTAFDNNINTNIVYGAAVLLLPIKKTAFTLASKLGIAYVMNSGDRSGFNNWYSIKNHYSPLFALGLEYAASEHISFNSFYTYVGGKTKNINTPVETYSPNIQIVTVGVGYRF
jgi:opacity protein-like surface antigen